MRLFHLAFFGLMSMLFCCLESCPATTFLCSQWLIDVTPDHKGMVAWKRLGYTDHHLLLLSSPGNTSFYKYMHDLIQGLDITRLMLWLKQIFCYISLISCPWCHMWLSEVKHLGQEGEGLHRNAMDFSFATFCWMHWLGTHKFLFKHIQ